MQTAIRLSLIDALAICVVIAACGIALIYADNTRRGWAIVVMSWAILALIVVL